MFSDVALENGGFTLNLWQFFHGGTDDKPWDLGLVFPWFSPGFWVIWRLKLRIVHLGVLSPAPTVGLLICILWLLTSLEPREDPWQSSERPSKAAGTVLRVLRLLRGAENVPDSSFEAQQKQLVAPREVPWQSSERPSKAAGVLRVLRLLSGVENVPDSSFEAQ